MNTKIYTYCMDGVKFMYSTNEIIVANINTKLKQQNKKQTDLADALGVPRQTISKILTSQRGLSAVELTKISGYLDVSITDLVKKQSQFEMSNGIKTFMGIVETEEARAGLRKADEIIDMILFHKKYQNNLSRASEVWNDA